MRASERTWLKQRPLARAVRERRETFVVCDEDDLGLWCGSREERGRAIAEELADQQARAVTLERVDRIWYEGIGHAYSRVIWREAIGPFREVTATVFVKPRQSALAERLA